MYIGIKIFDKNGNFKSLEKFLEDATAAWNDLNEDEKIQKINSLEPGIIIDNENI